MNQILTTQELGASGLSKAQIASKVARGELLRISRGIYCESQFAQSLTEYQKPLARIAAEYKACRNVVLSHESAALWQGAPLISMPQKVHFSTNGDMSHRRANVCVHRRRELPLESVKLCDGALVTSPLRTLEDCLGYVSLVEIVNITNYFLTRQEVSFESLYQLFDQHIGKRKVLGVIASQRLNIQCESPLETLVFNLVCDWDLPRPAQQVWLSTPEGGYRADFVWEDIKLILEADGLVKYSGKFGDPLQIIRQERARQRALERQGWRFVRVEWDEVVRQQHQLRQRLFEAGLR